MQNIIHATSRKQCENQVGVTTTTRWMLCAHAPCHIATLPHATEAALLPRTGAKGMREVECGRSTKLEGGRWQGAGREMKRVHSTLALYLYVLFVFLATPQHGISTTNCATQWVGHDHQWLPRFAAYVQQRWLFLLLLLALLLLLLSCIN